MRSGLVRLLLTSGIAVALVATALVVRSDRDAVAGEGYRQQATETTERAAAAAQAEALAEAWGVSPDGHVHEPGTSPHDENDEETRNAVSRSATVSDPDTVDPTTPREAEQSRAAVRKQRAMSDPPLTTAPVSAAQPRVPTDRYNLFNSCYGLQSTATGRWLRSEEAPDTGGSATTALPVYFKPTDLGRYLLHTPTGSYLAAARGALTTVARPGPRAEWTVTRPRAGEFRLHLPDTGYLAATDDGGVGFAATPTDRTQFTPVRRSGCTAVPEVQVNVTGAPAAGVTPYQEVRGYSDAHTHHMAFEFLGGQVHCGRPWSPWGVTEALKDCPDHHLTGGYGALIETVLSGKASHDPVGWPTFADWPAPDSLTHEGTYYKWMERSWRAGQRLLVNLLVENNQLCQLYPLKRNSCDDMKSIALQAKAMRDFERYVDAQHGGPGKGWYRIVTHPDEARRVANSGKIAVVMGIETSVLFNCHQRLGVPSCTKESIDRQLDEVQRLGVVQMELVNKFDNALAGVAGDEGASGYLVNAANLLETLSPWRMQTCTPNSWPEDDGVHDKNQDLSAPIPDQDALFGAVLKVIPGLQLPAIPVYPAKHHCNKLGLTDLGEHTIREMAKRHMIFDPDHMSVKARQRSMDVIEDIGYQGVISSHSWSTPDAYPRIYGAGGWIAPYAGDSTGFVEKWKRLQTWANPATFWGVGFGADINGLGAQGDPRPDAADNPVRYPFTGLGGVQVHRQQSGQRTYDVNEDGVAHYGLYPDWIEDLRLLAGDEIVQDLYRGTEAYLQMWERAHDIAPNACTNPGLRKDPSAFTRLPRGLSAWQVLERVGQPHRRVGDEYTFCSKGGSVVATFTKGGRLAGVEVGARS